MNISGGWAESVVGIGRSVSEIIGGLSGDSEGIPEMGVLRGRVPLPELEDVIDMNKEMLQARTVDPPALRRQIIYCHHSLGSASVIETFSAERTLANRT